MGSLLPTKISVCLVVLLQAHAIVSSHKSGYISIDCGAASPYNLSNISYETDEGYIATGTSMTVQSAFLDGHPTLHTVRSFPEGERNCYTLKPINGKDHNYLIQVQFMYGNYDGKNNTPNFDVYIGVNPWYTICPTSAGDIGSAEIIHQPTTDFIYICLVNTGRGTPFISELVLRPLDDSLYNTSKFASLVMAQRYNSEISEENSGFIRYLDDVYDRFWSALPRDKFLPWESHSTNIDLRSLRNDKYKIPPSIFRAEVRPRAPNHALNYYLTPANPTSQFYFYLHFAETQKIGNNETREFNIFVNGNPMSTKPVKLRYLEALTLASSRVTCGPDNSVVLLSINRTETSTLPPILNAIETYRVVELQQSATNQDDANAIMDVKAKYGANELLKAWEGDPCLPKSPWDGLNCIKNGSDSPRIISLNLASRGLSGEILPSLFSLKSLSYLNLSNNSLIGTIPEFLADMPTLLVIDLSGNKLGGSVPVKLTDRVKNGSLTLRLEGNPDLSENKKHKDVIAAGTASALLVLLIAIACVTYCKCRSKWEEGDQSDDEEEGLDLPLFALNTILRSTNEFADSNKLGEGGFGPVYKGVLEGGQEIAVKRLSHNSRQGQKEFKNEVKCIATLQHRNLVKLIGYCNEKEEQLLIYEFLSNKSLDVFIFDKTGSMVLDWPTRFEIIYGVARGIVYLHQDSRMRIVHRDLKASNILLDRDMKPKISDFGMARMFDGDQSAVQTKRVVGTYGYMPPEYAVNGIFSTKSDVFSFGVLVLEIVSGQRNREFAHTDDLNLLGHAWRLFMEGAALEIVDRSMASQENATQILRTIHIGLLCVQEYAEDRPSMSVVTTMLTGDSKLPSPKQPGFYVRRQVVNEESASLSSDIGSSTYRDSITFLSAR